MGFRGSTRALNRREPKTLLPHSRLPYYKWLMIGGADFAMGPKKFVPSGPIIKYTTIYLL